MKKKTYEKIGMGVTMLALLLIAVGIIVPMQEIAVIGATIAWIGVVFAGASL